jgi:hypothetical protein
MSNFEIPLHIKDLLPREELSTPLIGYDVDLLVQLRSSAEMVAPPSRLLRLDSGTDFTTVPLSFAKKAGILEKSPIGRKTVHTTSGEYETDLYEASIALRDAEPFFSTVIGCLPDESFGKWVRRFARRLQGKPDPVLGIISLSDVLRNYDIETRKKQGGVRSMVFTRI